MKLSYFNSVPGWLHKRATEMLQRTIDLENKYVHVTQLLSPAPQLRLMADNWKELEQPIDDLIPAMVGTAWHRYMEGALKGGFTERRIEYMHGDWCIIGTPDWYSHDHLLEFKTTRVWSRIFGGKDEWEQQLNIYRWLIYQATGLEVPALEVHGVYLDWSANAAKRTAGHPPKRWEVINIPVWGLDQARAFVDARIQAIESVQPGDYCSADERWERGAHWALMKHGRKSAVKKYETHAEALDALSDDKAYYLEEREGVSPRCLDWCAVKHLCPYGKNLAR